MYVRGIPELPIRVASSAVSFDLVSCQFVPTNFGTITEDGVLWGVVDGSLIRYSSTMDLTQSRSNVAASASSYAACPSFIANIVHL